MDVLEPLDELVGCVVIESRWNDHWCIDITQELLQVIQESWARVEVLPPYQIYVKMAYHLAQEARAGLSEFRIPPEFGDRLLDYQVAAVKIAAHHLNKRGGVLIGDVVGLGKTLMATALAKIFQDDHFTETLIICPKNLVTMISSLSEMCAMSGAPTDLLIPFPMARSSGGRLPGRLAGRALH